MKPDTKKKYVLQLCHDYKAPFLSVAKQYASLFSETEYEVVNVFLKGERNKEVVDALGEENVIFLNYSSKELRGLKRKQIKDIASLHKKYNFKIAIAQRYKSFYIASHIKDLFCIGVHHIRGGYSRWSRRLYIRSKKDKIAILGVSKAVRNNIRKDLSFIPEDKIQHLYNSLDFEDIRKQLYSKREARSKLGLSDTDYIIGNVGRLHKDKDQATLIRSFKRIHKDLPRAKVAIAGSGNLESSLKKQVKEFGLQDKVIFLGKVPNFYKYLNAFDCFALSSIREGLPVALLEAYAAGIPCTVSRCDGNEEAIESVGSSFEIGDDEELSRILKAYYHLTPQQLDEFSKKIEKKINSSFTDDQMRASFISLPFIKRHLLQS